MAHVNYPLVDKYPRVIGNISSRLSLLEKKVAVTQTATSSAILGASVTFAPTAPTVPPPRINDLWYDTSNGNKVSQFSGAIWVPYQFGTGGIANNAITNALLAGNSVSNTNLQTGSVGNANIQNYALSAGQAGSQYSGQNMITDAQFANTGITAARLADPATTGTWALSNSAVGTPFVVGHGSVNPASTMTFSPSSSVPVGCALVVMLMATASPGATVTDTQGNSYTAVSSKGNAFFGGWMYASYNSAALTTGDTITIHTSSSIHFEAVMYAIPLGFAADITGGASGPGASISYTTPNENDTGDINLTCVFNANNLLFTSGGGTPAGWSYLGGTLSASWGIEAAWQNAPSSVGQPVSTSYASGPADGWVALSIGVQNSGNAGHMTVTAQNPGVQLPLMPSNASTPSMYVNPGEQYFLSLNANVPGAVNCQIGIQLVLNTGTVLTVSNTGTGYHLVSGTVTIPPGASSAYVRVFAKSASGTVANCTILNPSCTLSSLYGSNWSLDNTGINVSSVSGASGGQAQLSVSGTNTPVLNLPTNVGSEQLPSAVYATSGNTGGANEFINMVLQGPASSSDGVAPTIFLASAAANGSSEASGQLSINGTDMLYWDTTGVHMVGHVYGTAGTITFGDNISLVSGKNISLGGSGVVSANQLLAGGVSTGASVGGTTGRFTGGVEVDGQLSVGPGVVSGTVAAFGASSAMTIDGGGNISCGGLNQIGATSNHMNGSLEVGLNTGHQNLTVHGSIITLFGQYPLATPAATAAAIIAQLQNCGIFI